MNFIDIAKSDVLCFLILSTFLNSLAYLRQFNIATMIRVPALNIQIVIFFNTLFSESEKKTANLFLYLLKVFLG